MYADRSSTVKESLGPNWQHASRTLTVTCSLDQSWRHGERAHSLNHMLGLSRQRLMGLLSKKASGLRWLIYIAFDTDEQDDYGVLLNFKNCPSSEYLFITKFPVILLI